MQSAQMQHVVAHRIQACAPIEVGKEWKMSLRHLLQLLVALHIMLCIAGNEVEAAVAADGSTVDVELQKTRGDLQGLNAKIERQRLLWRQSLAVIDNLTNKLRKPFKNGSSQYYQWLKAAKTKSDIEEGAPKLIAERDELIEKIKSLENERASSVAAGNTPIAPPNEPTDTSPTEELKPAHDDSTVQAPISVAQTSGPNVGATSNNGEFQYQPRVSTEDVANAASIAKNLVTSQNLVSVDGYQRQDGTIVSPYTRQPPGGIPPSEELKGDLAALTVGVIMIGADYFLQRYDHYNQKTEATPVTVGPSKTSAGPSTTNSSFPTVMNLSQTVDRSLLYAVVTDVNLGSPASHIGIHVGDVIISYNHETVGIENSTPGILKETTDRLYETWKRIKEGATEANPQGVDIEFYRDGQLLRAAIPIGAGGDRKIGITWSPGLLPRY